MKQQQCMVPESIHRELEIPKGIRRSKTQEITGGREVGQLCQFPDVLQFNTDSSTHLAVQNSFLTYLVDLSGILVFQWYYS